MNKAKLIGLFENYEQKLINKSSNHKSAENAFVTGLYAYYGKPAPPAPKRPPEEIVIGARAVKKGNCFINMARARPPRKRDPAATTVLLVEDDTTTRMILDLICKKAGFQTRQAADAPSFIAAIQKRMHVKIFHARFRSHVHQFKDLRLVAVHAAGRQQAQHMQRVGFAHLNRLHHHRVSAKFAGFNRMFNFRVILIHHAAGADVHVADFGIAHLPRGQAHHFFRSVDNGVRVLTPQKIPVRLARLANGVVVAFLAVAEAVENNQ